MAIVQRASNALNLFKALPKLASFLVNYRAHKAPDYKAARPRSLVPVIENFSLFPHVFLHSMRIFDGLLIHVRIPLRDELPNAARQIRIVRMMEIVRLAAFHKPCGLAQVMRHAGLYGNNLRFRVLHAQQRLSKLYHLTCFHQLASNEASHCVFVHGRTRKILELLVADELHLVQCAPVARHFLPNSWIN